MMVRCRCFGPRGCLAFYVFTVMFGAFAFILWGCYCDDPENGHPNTWNRVYHVKKDLDDPGFYVHQCSIGFSAFLGVEWCVALAVTVSLNLLVTLPVFIFLVHYYGWGEMIQSFIFGAFGCFSFFAILYWAVAGKDPPPGLGMSGIPIGGCITAGAASVIFFSLFSGYGYRSNRQLGISMERAIVFTLLSTGAGVYTTFVLHVGMGWLITLDLLAAGGFATQVYMVEGAGMWTNLAFALPLLLGGLTCVALEMSGLLLPDLVGTGIGLSVSFMVIAPLSYFFESRGVNGAIAVAATALLQDTIFVSAAVASSHLALMSGVSLACALEVISGATVWVWLKTGPDFGKFTGGYSMFVLLGFTPLLVYVQSFGWSLSLVISGATAGVEGLSVGVAFVYFGMINGLRTVFVMALTVLHANLLLLAVVTFELPAGLLLSTNVVIYVFLLGVLLLGFRYDDGSGWLYGSGVEVLCFVCSALLLAYGTGTVLGLASPELDAGTAQLAGVVTGGLLLLCPVVTRALTSKQLAKPALKAGFRVAAILNLCALLHIVLLHFVNGVSIRWTVRTLAFYALGYMGVMALGVVRFKVTLMGIYLIWVGSAAAAVALAFLNGLDWGMLMSLFATSAVATTGELAAVRALARLRSAQYEDVRLDNEAVAVRMRDEEREMIKQTKPRHDPKLKHALKAERLNEPMGGRLPPMSQLTFNGVMEHSGVIEWCEADGTRPTVPFNYHLLVARGSFYYLFPPSGARMPTARALGAIPLYNARCAMHDTFTHHLLPTALDNLLFIHLSIPWGGRGKNFFFRFSSRDDMEAWHADLTRRAKEKSSAGQHRKDIRRAATQQDPEIAPGDELLRKDRIRARLAREAEAKRRRLLQQAAFASGEPAAKPLPGRPARAGRGSDPRHVLGTSSTRNCDPTQKLRTVEVLGGHHIYTPRGISGTAHDETQHYELQPTRSKSLAKSAREAMEANAAYEAKHGGALGAAMKKRNTGEVSGPALYDGDDGETAPLSPGKDMRV